MNNWLIDWMRDFIVNPHREHDINRDAHTMRRNNVARFNQTVARWVQIYASEAIDSRRLIRFPFDNSRK